MLTSIQIPVGKYICDAWLAQPNGDGPWPGVILCMDAVGPRENLKTMAERLAIAGFVVLLPNIFYRDKKAPIVEGVNYPAQLADLPKILEQIMPLVMKFSPNEGIEDMRTFISYLENLKQVRHGRFGIFGYCMGGALAIRTAAAFPEKFAAVASFHAGGLVTDDAESPHLLLPRISAALYVGHADQDPHMTSEQIKTFDRAASGDLQITEVYQGAHHHFTMLDLPAYDRSAAERHWSRLLELFTENL